MQKINQCFAGLPHCPLRAAHRLITSCCLVFNEAGFLIKKKSPSPPDNLVLVLSCRPVCGYHRREVCRVLSACARVCVFVRARAQRRCASDFLGLFALFCPRLLLNRVPGFKMSAFKLLLLLLLFLFHAHTHMHTPARARTHTSPPDFTAGSHPVTRLLTASQLTPHTAARTHGDGARTRAHM